MSLKSHIEWYVDKMYEYSKAQTMQYVCMSLLRTVGKVDLLLFVSQACLDTMTLPLLLPIVPSMLLNLQIEGLLLARSGFWLRLSISRQLLMRSCVHHMQQKHGWKSGSPGLGQTKSLYNCNQYVTRLYICSHSKHAFQICWIYWTLDHCMNILNILNALQERPWHFDPNIQRLLVRRWEEVKAKA